MDLRSPVFRRMVWAKAHEFNAQVFGPDGSARNKDLPDIGMASCALSTRSKLGSMKARRLGSSRKFGGCSRRRDSLHRRIAYSALAKSALLDRLGRLLDLSGNVMTVFHNTDWSSSKRPQQPPDLCWNFSIEKSTPDVYVPLRILNDAGT